MIKIILYRDWSSADTAAAAQVASTAINYASAANTNKKQRKWMDENYIKQRADALADRDFMLDYNSPSAQQERLKAAGLNPNLVYGDGNAITSAPPVRSSDTGSWNPHAPQVDLTPAVDTLFRQYDMEQKQAQTENIKLTAELIRQQTLNTAANTQATGAQTATSKFNLQQLQAKALTDIEQVKANLAKTTEETENLKQSREKTAADTQYTLDQNERAKLINNQSLAKGLEEIANLRATRANTVAAGDEIRQRTKNLVQDEKLKELEAKLRERGYTTHDRDYLKIAEDLAKKIPSPKEFNKAVNTYLKNLWDKNLKGRVIPGY